MRVLVDTNIWVDFLNRGDVGLVALLEQQGVVMHSIILGELASGNLPRRRQTLHDLQQLPSIIEATEAETRILIEQHRLYGKGLHWNDLQLLASSLINPGVRLWTRDRRLAQTAGRSRTANASNACP